jgi:hypothetical protein
LSEQLSRTLNWWHTETYRYGVLWLYACHLKLLCTGYDTQSIERPADTRVNTSLQITASGAHAGDATSIAFFDSVGVDQLCCPVSRIPTAMVAAAQAHIRSEHRTCFLDCFLACSTSPSKEHTAPQDYVFKYCTIYNTGKLGSGALFHRDCWSAAGF